MQRGKMGTEIEKKYEAKKICGTSIGINLKVCEKEGSQRRIKKCRPSEKICKPSEQVKGLSKSGKKKKVLSKKKSGTRKK